MPPTRSSTAGPPPDVAPVPSSSSRPARQVVFSPHPPSLHPYVPTSRLSPSVAPRQTRLATLQTGLPSGSPRASGSNSSSSQQRGILKRTDSAEIRMAKDVQEGTRINGRLRSSTTLADDDDAGASSSVRGSPVPASQEPSTSQASQDGSADLLIDSHLRTILACGAPPDGPQPGDGRVAVSLPDLVESYSALITRFRSLPHPPSAAAVPSSSAVSPKGKAKLVPTAAAGPPDAILDALRRRPPALAAALARDLRRFFDQSPPPSVDSGSRDSSPADDDDDDSGGGGGGGRPNGKGLKKGFTEAEVTKRREEVQAGHGAIRLAGVFFSNAALWACFSDDDLQTILALIIRLPLPAPPPSPPPLTVALQQTRPPPPAATPTTASKRTITFAMHTLSQLTLPSRVLRPLSDDLLSAFLKPLANATQSTSLKRPAGAAAAGAVGRPAPAETPLKVKLECLGALAGMLRTNPDVLLPHHRTLVPQLLRLLLDPKPAIQVKASVALGAVLLGGRNWIRAAADARQPADELARARKVVEEEVALSVVKALSKKSPAGTTPAALSAAGKGGAAAAAAAAREDKLVIQLLAKFQAAYTASGAAQSAANPPPTWALATWAVVITLLGRNIQTNVSDLLEFMNVVRGTAGAAKQQAVHGIVGAVSHSGGGGGSSGGGIPGMAPLVQKGWDHVLHGIISQSSRRLSAAPPSPSSAHPSAALAPTAEADPVVYDLPWILAPKRTFLIFTNLNSAFARDIAPGLMHSMHGGKVWGVRGEASGASAILAKGRAEGMLAATDGFVNAVYAFSGAVIGERPVSPPASPHPAEGQGRILVPSTPASEDDGDGASGTALDRAKLDHLTTLMDTLVFPLLASHLLPIVAFDRIKLTGWRVLYRLVSAAPASFTTVPPDASRPSSPPPAWKLDKLLCQEFLNGSFASADLPAASADRQRALGNLCVLAGQAAVSPLEIPAWPRAWVAEYFARALELVKAAFNGARGLKDAGFVGEDGWVGTAEGVRVLPGLLSRIFREVLGALDSLGPAGVEKPSQEYLSGLALVASFIGTLFKQDVMSYRPPSMEPEANLDLVRYGLMDHLISVALDVLGEAAFGRVLLPTEDMVLGAGRGGAPTLAGILITTLIGTTLPPLGAEPAIRTAFVATLQKLVDAGLQGPLAFNLLGDLTSNLDKLAPGEDDEEEAVRFALWKMMAEKWIELYPSTATASLNVRAETNGHGGGGGGVPSSDADMDSAHSMTLRLLTDLLTDPFRRFPVLWTSASSENVATWGALLQTTVSRAVAKGMNPNIVVVEDLAAGLTDVDMVDIPCQATFDCLRFIALAVEYPGDHEPTNDSQLAARRFMKYFPEGFLELLALALDKAYPTVLHHPEMLGSAVDLLQSTGAFLTGLPIGYVAAAVTALAPALSMWVRDEHKVLKGEAHIDAVFDVYRLVLEKLAIRATTPEGAPYRVMQPTAESLFRFGVLFCASMHAATEGFVLAFRDFWAATFEGVQGLQYPADVEVLLKGLREINMGVDAAGLADSQTLPRIEKTQQPQLAAVEPFSDDSVMDDVSFEPSGRSSAGDSTYDADTSSTSPLRPVEELSQALSPAPLADVDLNVAASEKPVDGTLVVKSPVPEDAPPSANGAQSQATPSKKRRRQTSTPRSAPRSTKRRRSNSEESVVPATPSQPFEETVEEADIQDIIEMEQPAAALPVPTPARKKANMPRRSITKSASSGGLVSTVSSWIPRFFGSPAMQAEEAAVDGELSVSSHQSPDRDQPSFEHLTKELAERKTVTRSKTGSSPKKPPHDGPNDIFTPHHAPEPIDLTMVSDQDDEDEDAVVPDSDEQANRSTEPYDTPGTPKSARRSHRQVERRRLHESLPRPDTSVSLTHPGNGRTPLISAEMVDSDSEDEDAATSSVAGQDVEQPSQSVSRPAVAAETLAVEAVSDDVSTHVSPLAHRTRTSSGLNSPPPPLLPKDVAAGAGPSSSAASSAPTDLLALVQSLAPELALVGSTSNADLVQIQRLLAASMASVTQEMQDRLLR